MVCFPGWVWTLLLCSFVVAGCGKADAPASAAFIQGVVTAGPTCPTQADPPDPACAPRPVPSARITAINAKTGSQTSTVTDAEGRFSLEIQAGTVQLSGAPVEGLMGVPDPVEITALAGEQHNIDLVYDTGVR